MTFITRRELLNSSESEMVDLFFKALYRLGVWTADWEILYGTKPLAFPRVERRSVLTHHTPEPSPPQ